MTMASSGVGGTRLGNLWRESDGLHDFMSRVLRQLGQDLHEAEVAFMVREDPSLPWRVAASRPEWEAQLTMASMGGLLSCQPDQGLDRWQAIELDVAAPMAARLLTQGAAPGLEACDALAAGVSLVIARDRLSRADNGIGEIGRLVHALRQLASNIHQAEDISLLAEVVCAVVARATGSEVVALYQLEGDAFYLTEEIGVYRPGAAGMAEALAAAPEPRLPIPRDEAGFLAQALWEGRPLAIPNMAASEGVRVGLGHLGLLSAMAAPLLTPIDDLGVLLVGSWAPRLFSPTELGELAELAQAASGALLTWRLHVRAQEESRKAGELIARLHDLTRATREVGKTLEARHACEACVRLLPQFLRPAEWVDCYLIEGDDWRLLAGSSPQDARPPESWLYYLDRSGYPPSLRLEADALTGTGFEDAGQVLLFPMGMPQSLLGLVVVATERDLAMTGRDMAETLVAHAASAVFNAEQWRRAHEGSITDALTGVYNRRHFVEVYEQELAKAARYRRAFSIILLDIDHFKHINDRLGHLAGDQILREVANLLRDSVRKVDLVARYGGEEFALLLPETGDDGALALAEKLCQRFGTYPFSDRDLMPGRQVTASLGYASFGLDGTTAEQLMQTADEALYAAKRDGRNRVGVPPRRLEA
jgi:diguanylate cyclase (GGDEF)-like protein